MDAARPRLAVWLGVVAFIVLLGLIVHRADAADVSVSWTPPSSNVDGSAIPATGVGSIASYRIEWGSCSGTAFGTLIGQRTVTAPATSAVVTGLAPGSFCFRAFARNTYGAESAASNVAARTIDAPVPNPPIVAVAVVAGLSHAPVYSITAAGKLSTLMGFVPVGTACARAPLLSYRGKAFHEVARADVQWWGSTTLRVAAPCA